MVCFQFLGFGAEMPAAGVIAAGLVVSTASAAPSGLSAAASQTGAAGRTHGAPQPGKPGSAWGTGTLTDADLHALVSRMTLSEEAGMVHGEGDPPSARSTIRGGPQLRDPRRGSLPGEPAGGPGGTGRAEHRHGRRAEALQRERYRTGPDPAALGTRSVTGSPTPASPTPGCAPSRPEAAASTSVSASPTSAAAPGPMSRRSTSGHHPSCRPASSRRYTDSPSSSACSSALASPRR